MKTRFISALTSTLLLGCRDEFAPFMEDDTSIAELSSTTSDVSSTTSDSSTSIESTSEDFESSSSSYNTFCGNGIVDPGEECEQGDPYTDFSCNHLCIRSRVIFISSLEFKGSEIGGIYKASEICKSLAHNAGLENWNTFESFLSNSITNARDRVFHSKGYYISLYEGGTPVARNFEDLVSGNLLTLPRFDENGNVLGGGPYSFVWTGTGQFGFRAQSPHCDDWTNNPPGSSGIVGDMFAFDTGWLYEYVFENPTSCDKKYPIYCIEGQ